MSYSDCLNLSVNTVEVYDIGDRKGLSNGGRTTVSNRQKSDLERQYTILALKTDPIERALGANREQQYKLNQELNNLTEKYLQELDKGRELQHKLDVLGDYNMDELTKDLERAKKSERDLESNLKIMVENPWFTSNQTQANVTQNLRVRKI